MSSHIPSHRTATDAARTDDARGPDGTPPDAARDAVQLDGDVVLSLLAVIGGGGAELKDAAGGGQGNGRPASTAPGPARDGAPWPRPAPGMRGGTTGPVTGTGTATQTGSVPALTGSTPADGDAVAGIVPDEGGDAAQRQAPDWAAPEGALPRPSAPEGGLSPPSGAGNAWPSAADAQPALRTADRYVVAPHADGAVGETTRAPAEATAFAESAGPLETLPRAGAGAPAAQNEPLASARGHAPSDAEPQASTLPAIATATTQTQMRMPTARRGEAASPARAARDAMADAAGTAGRYASATVRRAGTLAATTGRSLAAHGAALPGVRALEANLVERGWLARRARPSAPADEAGIGTGAGTDAGDPSSVASGNEAAGVVNVVRFVVQAREWLDERRPRAPAGGCPHRRSLRCRWHCRAGCTRRGP
ncbi:hypothetical protein BLA39750_03299 [Burkholderia lata]|uniref:Uncharacterized protein n=1 Tax=Burkholderia lata (strain ATCC 17760 / DSM 23089 / LMG 22485 / NCIMB 9086 / R18194 / 383) TaxID=482957 RepID=A0A6P2XRW3_BURL3|nr:hypothetical protein [Burkholderia lata]VWD12074.1 hypothetical protein BLA39750_03299 [Burkholderia lata]